MQAGAVARGRRDRRPPPGPDAGRRARPGRGRLPHRRHQGRRRGPLAARRSPTPRARRPRRSRATATRSRWCSAACIPIDGDDFETSARALEKLRLNDASLTYEPETSGALGFGFRCGFLGLLHMEIVRERLEREFDLGLIATAPSVEYRVHTHRTARSSSVDNPADLPPPQRDRRTSRSRSSRSRSSRRPTTPAR